MNIKALIWNVNDLKEIISEFASKYNTEVVYHISDSNNNSSIIWEKLDITIINLKFLESNQLQKRKDIKKQYDIPIVLLATAEKETFARKLISTFAADDYLLIPFSAQDLAAKIKDVLSRKKEDNKCNNNIKLCLGLSQNGLINF